MKTEFRAKYLQHLLSKKNKSEGFTLIELLVVIIIVGVLSAIALPSFLNQIGKARGSEAKAALGTINRSQQAYRLENNTMAGAITSLDAKLTPKFYTYAVALVDVNNATATSTATQADLKVYSSRVSQNGNLFEQILCESEATVAINVTSTVPASVAQPAAGTTQGGCAATYRYID